MDDNVFASGQGGANPTFDGGSATLREPAPVELIPLFERAWQLILANLHVVGPGVLILYLIAIGDGLLRFAVQLGGAASGSPELEMVTSLVGVAMQFVAFLVQIFFQIGLIRALVDADRGHEVAMDALWSQGDRYLYAVIGAILMGLIGIAVAAPGLLIGASLAAGMYYAQMDPLTSFGLAGLVALPLAIVPAAIVQFGLMFTLHRIADTGESPVDALRTSWAITDGHKLFLFLQALTIGLLVIVVMCMTCLLGGPLGTVFTLALQAATYNALLHLHGQR